MHFMKHSLSILTVNVSKERSAFFCVEIIRRNYTMYCEASSVPTRQKIASFFFIKGTEYSLPSLTGDI